jgi:hypothetical protein
MQVFARAFSRYLATVERFQNPVSRAEIESADNDCRTVRAVSMDGNRMP